MMKGRETQMFEGVEVRNFPVFTREGEKSYPLSSAVVSEKIAKQIPEEIRTAVFIDYDRIPEALFEKEGIHRGREQTPEQKAAEEKLIKVIFGE